MGESVDSDEAFRVGLERDRPDDRARTAERRADASPDGASPGEAPPADAPPPGLYRHHKGAEYRVLGCVRHSETEERLVLYRALYGERGLWVRPLGMFVDAVEKADGLVPRFALVQADDATS